MRWFFLALLSMPLTLHAGSATQQPPGPISSKWSYSVDEDPMTGKKAREARVAVSTPIELSRPYEGRQYPILVVSSHPKLGKQIYIRITRGQMLCALWKCQVTVRFDDEQPIQWTAARASDGDSTWLFLMNYDAFVKRLSKAKRLRIQPEFYRNGFIVLEFPVEGFDPARYAKGG